MSTRADRFERVPWGAVALFVVLACGLAWLVALPLWMTEQERPGFAELFRTLASAMMFTPAVAAVVVVFVLRAPRRERMRFLGLWPLRPARRVVWFAVCALFAPILLVGACLAVSSAFGWVKLDLVHFSGFQQMIDAQLAALDPEVAELASSTMLPLGILVTMQIAAIPLNALVGSITAFGEEIGWRGWLLPALRPMGVWPALLLSGTIWGLWHSPVILLGYNFNRTDWSGVALMTAGAVVWGVLFGWVRLRSGSVWPAVLGHAALNASAGLLIWLPAAGVPVEMALVNPLGVSGWIVVGVIVLILLLTRQFGPEPELAPKRVAAAPARGGHLPPGEPGIG